ncbi:prolyl oligopeptidase family serine peptidase [Verrucomicrobiaceae bacterium 227]
MLRHFAAFIFILSLPALAAEVRRIPPAGIEMSEVDQKALEAGLRQLGEAMKGIAEHPLLPDVEIYHKAVRDSLKHREFQKPAEIKFAREQLLIGLARAESLKKGEAPWTKEHGLVVRGFRSRIDGSVQPYGLVIPKSYQFDGEKNHRLDLWFHGRDDTVNEVAFIQRRRTDKGQYTPEETIMLHPYARFSNANKLAGEIDCLEALEHVKSGYRVDPDRILVRGFSMGGAACWQFAVHYADQWCAANPGAGFAETPEFLKMCDGVRPNPPAFQQTLWRLYDCTGYASNLFNLPTVAYSGEIDQQKQAADMMAKALQERGLPLTHIIGPKTAHKIEEGAKVEVAKRLNEIVEKGRERFPKSVRLETYTLRYNRMFWVEFDGLKEHWKRAYLEAESSNEGIKVGKIENVTALTFSFPQGAVPFEIGRTPALEIDGQTISGPVVKAGEGWQVKLLLEDGKWTAGGAAKELSKRHLLQGPVDDAFMDSFLFVAPGKSGEGDFSHWENGERERAVTQWRQQFRGDVRLKKDDQVSDDDIADHNLILWGNPGSNAVLAKIADKLPIRWNEKEIKVGHETFDARTHALIMIYPNPLNPGRYVVLNSGFTYREFDYLNNARQVPKIPDWAVIDLSEAPGPERPGRFAAAGFFDENWQLK